MPRHLRTALDGCSHRLGPNRRLHGRVGLARLHDNRLVLLAQNHHTSALFVRRDAIKRMAASLQSPSRDNENVPSARSRCDLDTDWPWLPPFLRTKSENRRRKIISALSQVSCSRFSPFPFSRCDGFLQVQLDDAIVPF